ncbi:hypothetical protein GCM10017567_52550 [Amycolatopsis bullii]|uniref:Uncharacterized protein n=1 Tax=Amycolatopsis bullii TaxID=941987 RepID=A0ABQ3KKR3_9PSEU|nr:hypothetical protein GCM10017567_52550 [Amycolatopsis bullii]
MVSNVVFPGICRNDNVVNASTIHVLGRRKNAPTENFRAPPEGGASSRDRSRVAVTIR